jgi:O-antigen ligase
MSHTLTWPRPGTAVARPQPTANPAWLILLQFALFALLSATVAYEAGTFEQGFSRAQLLAGSNMMVLGTLTLVLLIFSLLLSTTDAGLLILALLFCSMSVTAGDSGFAIDLPVQPVLLVNLPRLVLQSMRNRKASRGWVYVLMVIVLASALACDEPFLALRSTVRFGGYVVGGLCLGLTLGSQRDHIRNALLLFVSGGFLIALRAIYGLVFAAQTVNDLGLNFAMPFVQDRGSGTACLLFGVTSAWPLLRGRLKTVERVALWLSVMISLLVVIVSGARAAYIGLLGAILFAAVAFSLKYTRRLLLIAVLCLCAVALLTSVDPGYLGSLADRYSNFTNYVKDGRDFQTYDRLDYWDVALRIASSYPLLGIGYDQFSMRAYEYGGVRYGLSAHNEYLKLLSECGLIAVLLYLAVIARALIVGIRARRIPGYSHLIEAATVGIFCYSVQGFFNNFQQVSKIMVPYFFFIGVVECFRGWKPRTVR